MRFCILTQITIRCDHLQPLFRLIFKQKIDFNPLEYRIYCRAKIPRIGFHIVHSNNQHGFEEPYLSYKSFYDYLLTLEGPYVLLNEIKRGLLLMPRGKQENFIEFQAFSAKCTDLVVQQAELKKLNSKNFSEFITEKQTTNNKKIEYYQNVISQCDRENKNLQKTKPFEHKLRAIKKFEFYSYLWLVGGIVISGICCGLCCTFFPMTVMPVMGALSALLVAFHGLCFCTTHLSLKLLSGKRQKYKEKQKSKKEKMTENNKSLDHYGRKKIQLTNFNRFLCNLANEMKTHHNVPEKAEPLRPRKSMVPPRNKISLVKVNSPHLI